MYPDTSGISGFAVTTIFVADTGYMYIDGDKRYKWIQLVSGRHVSGVNAALKVGFHYPSSRPEFTGRELG